ncbi:YkgJ family cysteine cluster protein [Sulfurirhabdus autotrophica]|nr:YkgJ family cysteine cluster protein [Sulfurirhabdus autotrophica]
MLSPEEQSEFLSAIEKVQHAALNQLCANQSIPFAITFISKLQLSVDQVVHTSIDRQSIDCRAGCSHCCNVRVEALEPEIFLIAQELRKNPPDKLREVIVTLRQHVEIVKDVSIQNYHFQCPFLKDHLCSIYPVRPAICIKVHSFDVEKCKTPGAEIPQNLNIVLKSDALIKGTANAYQQIKLSASGHELGQAVLLALTDESSETKWYNGEPIFD